MCTVGGGSLREEKEKTDKQRNTQQEHGEWGGQKLVSDIVN